jgi:toxin ParE1/3/4
MLYKIELRPLATIEIIEAYDWYELQKEGLGVDFLNELDQLYETLHRNANTYSYYEKPVREGKVNRFPYTVVYEVFDTNIVIYSVFMAKQDPSKKRTG